MDLRELCENTTMKTIKVGFKADRKSKVVQTAKDTAQARPRVRSKAAKGVQKAKDMTQVRPRSREFCSKRAPEKTMPDKREKAKKPEETCNSPVLFKIKMRKGNVHWAGFAEKAKRRFALSFGEN